MATHDTMPEAGEGLQDWRLILRSLHACFQTGSFETGARLVAEIATIADQLGHHPDVLLRFPHVLVTTTSHDVGAVTDRDHSLARRISQAAADLGVPADTTAVGNQEIAIDAMDISAVRPFWRAVLGYQPSGEGEAELSDPFGRHPTVWFQQMDAPRPQRNRIHLDVWVPEDRGRARVQEAIDAGGRLLSNDAAPSFWVLADPEGNEACVCTVAGRAQ